MTFYVRVQMRRTGLALTYGVLLGLPSSDLEGRASTQESHLLASDVLSLRRLDNTTIVELAKASQDVERKGSFSIGAHCVVFWSCLRHRSVSSTNTFLSISTAFIFPSPQVRRQRKWHTRSPPISERQVDCPRLADLEMVLLRCETHLQYWNTSLDA